jgi:hypothetical protein
MAYEMIVRVFRDGNEICALTGPDLMAGTAGFGATVSSALRSLADHLESQQQSNLERSEDAA